ncbi:tRNA-splicing endonuclease subunit Sen2 [Sergentomyia squamirostris]
MFFREKHKSSKVKLPKVPPVPVESVGRPESHIALLGDFFVEVHDLKSVESLRRNGCFGILTTKPNSEDVETQILILMKEEAFFLHFCLQCLTLVNDQDEVQSTRAIFQRFCSQKKNFISTFVAYQYLKSKKWVIKSGLKFCTDFLLYRESPSSYHSSYAVFIQSIDSDALSGTDIQALHRATEISGKEILILKVHASNESREDCLETKFKNYTVSEVNPSRFTFHPTQST